MCVWWRGADASCHSQRQSITEEPLAGKCPPPPSALPPYTLRTAYGGSCLVRVVSVCRDSVNEKQRGVPKNNEPHLSTRTRLA